MLCYGSYLLEVCSLYTEKEATALFSAHQVHASGGKEGSGGKWCVQAHQYQYTIHSMKKKNSEMN